MKARLPYLLSTLLLLVAMLLASPASFAAGAPPTNGGLPAAVPTSSGPSPKPAVGGCAGFSDVSPTDYFCPSVETMVSYGWISGYSGTQCSDRGLASPCFLPYNNVTRAQFSKILVNTYRWPINTSGGPHFSDVPTTDWAYGFIETAYNRGIISGYSGTDCTNYGLGSPCFKPGNQVTRGQEAKMSANAFGYNDVVTGHSPSYYDVPSGSTFYDYIERLVMHAANAPYPPGAPPPPFCGPTWMPCFYPYTAAFRADAVQMILGPLVSLNYAQDFPYKGGTFDGVSVYMTTPDLSPIPSTAMIGGPVGASDVYIGHFIESGPAKECRPSCQLHPYENWDDTNGGNNFFWDTSVNLAVGGTYLYQSVHIGGGQWQAQFCDGVGCRGLATTGYLGTSLPFVVAAGESTDYNVSFGTITASGAQAHQNGSWSSWCYDAALAPWRTNNNTVSSCSNNSWTVQYHP